MYGKGVFCHTCQTNQMLLSNLLSNYLPPPTVRLLINLPPSIVISNVFRVHKIIQDPEYANRLSLFDAYRDSIEVRYPPVCAQCQPAVEEEIRKRDQMARTSALGAFLKDSRGKGKQRQVSNSQKINKEKFERALVGWRIRGVLWAMTVGMSVISYLTGMSVFFGAHSQCR